MFGHATHHDNQQLRWSATGTPASTQQYEQGRQHHISQQQPQEPYEQYQRFHHPQSSIDLQNHQQIPHPYQYTLAQAPSSSLYGYSANAGSLNDHFSRSSTASPSSQPVVLTTDYATLQHSEVGHQPAHHEQMASSDPPGSSHSAGSGSASSCESAVTAGPAHYTQQAPASSLTTTTVQGASVPVTEASSHAASSQASPLFDVPPGYRTMLSSDKHALTREHEIGEGGSEPARHNSMPSTTSSALFSSSVAQSHSEPSPFPSNPRPAHHQYSASASSSSTSALPSSSTYVHTPLPYYTPGVPYDQAPLQQQMYAQQSMQASTSAAMYGQSLYHQTASSSLTSQSQGQNHGQDRTQFDQTQSLSSSSRPHVKGESSTHFLTPTPPSSAPANISTFAMAEAGSNSGPTSRLARVQSETFKLEPSEDTFTNLARTSVSSSITGRSTNPSSAAHSRSTSVSSISHSSFGPLSASTSSSASSSFGEFPASTSTPRKSMRLSNLDRKALCQYAEANPRVKHEHIGSMFGVERSTVSKILKQRAKWFSTSGDVSTPLSPSSERKPREPKIVRNKLGRHPEMEARLTDWGREQTRNNVIVTDEQVKTRALEIAEDLNIDVSVFKASTGWLENFKNRGRYHGGKFDLEPPPLILSQEASGQAVPGEASDSNAEDSPLGREDQSGQAVPLLAGNHMDVRQDFRDSMSSPGLSSVASPGYNTLHGIRRQKRGTLSSLSSSALSLPDLVERDEQHFTDLQHSSSSLDLQSGKPSFSISNMPSTYDLRPQQQSFMPFSADPSPFPSPTCSAGSDSRQHGVPPILPSLPGPATHTFTPTQRTAYNASFTPQSGDHQFTGPYGSISASNQLEQAGINFNLSLNSSPSLLPQVPVIYDDHATFTHYGLGDGQDNTIYSNRTRVESDPGGLRYHQPHQYSTRYSDNSSAQGSIPQTVYSAFSSNTGSPVPSAQSTSQQKSPLRRSQTDPMPLYYAMGSAEAHQSIPDEDSSGAGDSTIMQSGTLENYHADSYMDVEPMLAHSHIRLVATLEGQEHSEEGHSYKYTGMPRRATVSSAGGLSFSSSGGSGHSHGHAHSYSTDGVPGSTSVHYTSDTQVAADTGDNEVISLSDAYLSLRKVLGYLRKSSTATSSLADLADSSQLNTLEAVLARLKQAHTSQVPTLTPPRSS